MKNKLFKLRNLESAIKEGAYHLTRNFDSERNDLPWFEVRLEKNKPSYLFHFESLDEPHAPGRALDAMLAAETMTSFKTSDDVIKKYKKAMFRSIDALDRLPGIINSEGKRQVFFHNFRETLLAYNALYRYRRDKKAYELANEMIDILLYLENGKGYWDSERIKAYREKTGNPDFIENNDPSNSAGRLIYALLKWYETTGDEKAYKLAGRFSDYALKESYDENGNFTDRVEFHVHSITSTFFGICDYELTKKEKNKINISRLEKIFKKSILPLSSLSGWVKELKDRPKLIGEVNCTGDIIQAMIALYRLTNKTEYLSRAEKAIRGHLLPSQVFPEDLPEDLVIQAENPDEEHKNVAQRLRGGFGFPTPADRAPYNYDYPFCRVTTLDITGGAVQALTRIRLFAVEKLNEKFKVNFLLDTKIQGFYLKQNSLYDFTMISALSVEMRIPLCKGFYDNDKFVKYSKIYTFTAGRHKIKFNFDKVIVKEELFGEHYETVFVGEQAVSIIPAGINSDMFSLFLNHV